MEWIDTQGSSAIARIGYDEASQILTVEFTSGIAYNYYDLPTAVFEQLKAAPSKGQFVTQNIKGTYRYARA
jgi:hypothetical protein